MCSITTPTFHLAVLQRIGSGSLEMSSGGESERRFGTHDEVMTGPGIIMRRTVSDIGVSDRADADAAPCEGVGEDERAADVWASPVKDSQGALDALFDSAAVEDAEGAVDSADVTTGDEPLQLDDLSLQDSPPSPSNVLAPATAPSSPSALSTGTVVPAPVPTSLIPRPADCVLGCTNRPSSSQSMRPS